MIGFENDVKRAICMKKYKDLENAYNELEAKYSRLLSEKSRLEYELTELKASAENIRRQDGEIRTLHENVRRIKHDMKNHLMVIASYLSGNDYPAAKAYTSQILDKLSAVHSYIETGNLLMNHILNEKLNQARENGISVKAEIENLSFKRMESLDFSALLSNFLDNAIEASGSEKYPEIQVAIAQRRGYETILVKNRISASVLDGNPQLATTKQNQKLHGIGTLQIKEITEKYGGMCDFYEEAQGEDDYFCACAFIPV